MHLALVHYLYAPTVGGVERVIEEQAALFARNGHRVTVLCGGGRSRTPGVEVRVLPDLRSGAEPPVDALRGMLEGELADADVVFVHNMMTMPFNLAATEALAELAADARARNRFVSWIHDLAATNPEYDLGDRLARHPWNLLARALPGFRHIAVSEHRRREFHALTGASGGACAVIPNGIDAAKALGLSPAVATLEHRHGILDRDIVLLQPARILRRKQVGLGLRVTAALRRAGHDALYLVTGAPDPHHPAAAEYGAELRAETQALDLANAVVFAGSEFAIGDGDLAGLYALADAVFLPGRGEGFGLPLLEGALHRLPVYCADSEPLRSLLRHQVNLFAGDAAPEHIAADLAAGLGASPAFRARKETLARYAWHRIYEEFLLPLCLDTPRPSREF